jgi:hypothetical protein
MTSFAKKGVRFRQSPSTIGLAARVRFRTPLRKGEKEWRGSVLALAVVARRPGLGARTPRRRGRAPSVPEPPSWAGRARRGRRPVARARRSAGKTGRVARPPRSVAVARQPLVGATPLRSVAAGLVVRTPRRSVAALAARARLVVGATRRVARVAARARRVVVATGRRVARVVVAPGAVVAIRA